MSRRRFPRDALFLYGLFLTLGAGVTAFALMGAGASSGQPFPLGISSTRLALGVLLMLTAGVCAWFSFGMLRRPSLAEELWKHVVGKRGRWVGLALFLTMGVAANLPAYRLPDAISRYFVEIQPLFLWLAAAGAGILTLLLLEPKDAGFPKWPGWRLTALIFSCLLLIWIFIASTGLGIRFREDYWYGAGVPALLWQVLFALGAGLLAARLDIPIRAKRWLDPLLFLAIWILAGLLWAVQPLHSSFFLPGPFQPTGDFYPFSDAITFDVGGQFVLIGQGILNGAVFDRALYMGFSAYLHALAGQEFARTLAIQAAIFAVLPAILYLLGKEIHGRALGIAVAVLSALRGINSIAAATWIDAVNPKMPMTDFPTAIGVALFTLFLVQWAKDPRLKWTHAMWAGGLLGLSFLLRSHVLLLLPAAAGLVLIVQHWNWRHSLPALVMLVAGMLAATTPWDLRNQSRGAPFMDLYFSGIRVVLQARYHWPPLDSKAPVPPIEGQAAADSRNGPFMAHQRVASPQLLAGCHSLPCHITNHLFHNVAASALILPTSTQLDDLRHTVKESLPYWRQDWLGEGFGLSAAILLILNLGLIALGVGISWSRTRWAALIPLFAFVTYNISNALAQTSGGRYIVPIDWVVTLYFLLGGLGVVGWAACRLGSGGPVHESKTVEIRHEPETSMRAKILRGAATLLLIMGIGGLLPLAEILFPLRYPAGSDATASLAWIEQNGSLEQLGLTMGQLETFLSQPGAGIWKGRALYPRYYGIGHGETAGDFPYQFLPYPRMAFSMIGPAGLSGVILPGGVRGRFENASDVLVVGCYTSTNQGVTNGGIDALAIFFPERPRVAYARYPIPELQCPMPEPICIDKETCY